MLSRSSRRAILLSEEMSGPEDFALFGVSCNGSDPTVPTLSDPIGVERLLCPSCGGAMRIIETFESGHTPPAPPHRGGDPP